MSTRGKGRVMFASDSPVLSITRCIKEAARIGYNRHAVIDRGHEF